MQQLHAPTQSIKHTSLRRKFTLVIEKPLRWAFQIERRAAMEVLEEHEGGGHKSTPFAPFPNGLGRRTEDGGRRTEAAAEEDGRAGGTDPFPLFPPDSDPGIRWREGGIQFIMHLRNLSLQILGSVAASAIVGGTRHIDKPPKKKKVLREKNLRIWGEKFLVSFPAN